MSAILESENIALVGTEMASVREFALRQISGRLASEPHLASAFWRELGEPIERPNLTVVYCSVRWLGKSFALFEFAAGQTLEELVKQSDPAACEREIPLFCRILDSFEGSERAPHAEQNSPAGLELLDFGIGRAKAELTSKLHGAVLVGPDGFWKDSVFGEYGASKSQIFAALMKLCAQMPGEMPKVDTYGAANLGLVSTCSLATQSPRREQAAPAKVEEPPPVPKRHSIAGRVVPYIIALATTVLILLMFYGVGGYLAKRTPTDSAKLVLPPMPVEPPEAPVETAPPPPVPPVAAARNPPRQAAAPPPAEPVISKPVADRKKRPTKPLVPSVVLTRGARPILQTNLEYPAEARKENVTGLVELQITIAEDGSVQSPRVLSGDPLLRAGLAEAVSHWVYQPMRVNGKPVPMTTEMAIRFTLN